MRYLVFALLFLGITSCAGRVLEQNNGSVPLTPAFTISTLPAPNELARGASAGAAASLAGADYVKSWPCQAVTVLGTQGQFSPHTGNPPTVDGMAFSIYHANCGGRQPQSQLALDWATAPPEGELWVALSDWDRQCWKWFSSSEASRVTVEDIGNYINGDGDLLLLIAVSGQQPALLNGCGFQFNPSQGPDEWWCYGHDRENTCRSPYIGPADATLKWQFRTNGPSDRLYSGPEVAPDGTIYIGGFDEIHALNPDMSVKWYTETVWTPSELALSPNGTLLALANNNVWAINPDGSIKWEHDTENALGHLAVGPDNTAYASDAFGNLLALNTDNTVKWQVNLLPMQSRLSVAVAADNSVVASCADQESTKGDHLVCLNADSSTRWTYALADGVKVAATPAIKADGTTYAAGTDGQMYSFSPSGALNWTYFVGTAIGSTPAIGYDGTIYFGSYDNQFYALNPDGTLAWSYTTGGRVGSPAIAPDGTIQVGSLDGHVYAFTTQGTVSWTATVPYPTVTEPPAFSSTGSTYLRGADDAWLPDANWFLYALNSGGTQTWAYPCGSAIYSSPVQGPDGTLYFGSLDGNVYAVNPDGSLKWKYATGGMISAGAAVGADGTVYIGSYDHYFYALNPDGSLAWSYETGDWIKGSPAINYDDTVIVTSYDGKVYAFITPGGMLKWTYDTHGPLSGSLAIAPDHTVYLGDSRGHLVGLNPVGQVVAYNSRQSLGCRTSPSIGPDGTVYLSNYMSKEVNAYDPAGHLLWTFTGDDLLNSTALGADGSIYVNDRQGVLYSISSTGVEQWRLALGRACCGTSEALAIDANGTIYMGHDGWLYAVDPNGTPSWSYHIGSFDSGSWIPGGPSIGGDGTVYVGDYNGKLYAFGPGTP